MSIYLFLDMYTLFRNKIGLFFERFEDTKNSFLRLTDLYVTNVPNNLIITVKIYCTLESRINDVYSFSRFFSSLYDVSFGTNVYYWNYPVHFFFGLFPPAVCLLGTVVYWVKKTYTIFSGIFVNSQTVDSHLLSP